MRRAFRKALGAILAALMCVNLLPISSLADDGEDEAAQQVVEISEYLPEEPYTAPAEPLSESEPEEWGEETPPEAAEELYDEEEAVEMPEVAADVPRDADEDALDVSDREEQLLLPAEPEEDAPAESEAGPSEEPVLPIWEDGEESASLPVSGTCGANVTWELDEEGVLTITGTGDMSDYTDTESNMPWYDYNADIKSVVVGAGITAVPMRAFIGCSALTSVSLPEGLEWIGYSAFQECTALPAISIPDSVTELGSSAFYRCTALRQVRLPAGVDIPSGHFEACSALEDIVIPEGVTKIAANAFRYCTALRTITLPAALTSVGNGAFTGCSALESVFYDGTEEQWNAISVQVGNGPLLEASDIPVRRSGTVSGTNITWKLDDGVLTVSGSGVLTRSAWSCYKDVVTSVVVEEGITGIGNVFSGHTALRSVSLPESLTQISAKAFRNCTALTAVEIPASVSSIGDEVFYGCTALKTVTLHEGLESIGARAFQGCADLESIELPLGIASLGGWLFMDCTGIKNMDLPDSITSLGDGVLLNCSSLESVKLPANLTAIGAGLLSGCSSLTSVDIPETVTTIGEQAFNGCTLLRELVIPAGVLSIQDRAFVNIPYLQLHFRGAPPEFSSRALNGGVIAYYPADDPAWTEEILEELQKSIIWLEEGFTGDAEEDDPPDETEDLVPEKASPNVKTGYDNWAEPVVSYIVDNGDGTWSAVYLTGYSATGYGYTGGNLIVETYDSDGALVWKKTLDSELPLWGGFYEGTDYYFLVCGQSNYESDPEKEVVRVVRYTKNWHRVDSVGLYGTHTYVPFSAGSLSMVQCGDALNIHTCHEMNNGHQASMELDVFIPTMTITSALLGVSYFDGTAYVSHSFNQFITVSGNDLILADHGDAYPRSVTLLRLKDYAGSPFRASATGTRREVMDISGKTGNNVTGVTLGGLEASGTSYLIAGNSVDHSTNDQTGQRNIFVSVTGILDFETGRSEIRWITDFQQGDNVTVSAPKLVKLGEDRFLLLWTESLVKVRYVLLDGRGEMISEIFSMDGLMTDGQPAVIDGHVIWYVVGDIVPSGSAYRVVSTVPVMYSIDLSDLTKTEVRTVSPQVGTVRFLPLGGTVSETTRNTLVGRAYGELPVPVRSGYTFDGWFTASSGGEQITADTVADSAEDRIVYAHWTLITYRLTYDAMGGICYYEYKDIVPNGAYGTLPTTNRAGYTFDGWYSDPVGGERVTAQNTITDPAGETVYAHWTPDDFSVYFNAAGGTVTESQKTVTMDTPYGALPTPARTGYDFEGWYTARSGGNQVTENTIMDKAAGHTLYARWTTRTYTVTFDANGGEDAPAPQVKTYGTTLTLSAGQPTRRGCRFLGWSLWSASNQPSYQPGDTFDRDDDTILYAVWEAYAPGDINGDGAVNTGDLIRLIKYINRTVRTVPGNPDVNGDGQEDVRDLIRLMKFVNGEKVDIY